MRMLLLGLFLCLPAFASELPSEIKLASEAWDGYTNADGTGLSWDVLRAVFEPAGVKLDIQSVPYTRSVGLARAGKIHAWVGAYRDEVPGMHYPRWHYEADQVYAVGLKTSPEAKLETLGDYRLAWIRGYGFERMFPQIEHFREIDNRSNVPAMLRQGHVDYFLCDSSELDEALPAGLEDKDAFRSTRLTQLPLYLGFANTPDALALAELFDQRMDAMLRDGSLRPIFQRWNEPYPYDD